MQPLLCVLTTAAAIILAGCVAQPPGPRVSTDPLWNSNRELEPPDSLPPGFTTNHPFPPATGIISVTRVP